MSAFGHCDVCEKPDRALTRCKVSGLVALACEECRQVAGVVDLEEAEYEQAMERRA